METNDKTTKETIAPAKPAVVRTVQLSRILHIVQPPEGSPVRRFQGVLSDGNQRGKLVDYRCTQSLWEQIYGSRTESTANYGIRDRFKSVYLVRLARLNPKKPDVLTAVGIDIIPARSFTRGAAPTEYLDNRKTGFEVRLDEALNGFVVEDSYAGLDQKGLVGILDAIRNHDATDRKTFLHAGHRIEHRDDVTWKVTPVKPPAYKA